MVPLPDYAQEGNFADHGENIFGNVISISMLCVPSEMSQNIDVLPEVKSVDEFPLSAS